jgi:hypothetical protein
VAILQEIKSYISGVLQVMGLESRSLKSDRYDAPHQEKSHLKILHYFALLGPNFCLSRILQNDVKLTKYFEIF